MLRLLIRYYVNRYANLEIVKIPKDEELDLYLFKNSSDVLKLIKNNITIQTLRYFEAKNDYERAIVKGASLALQVMKDRHLKAVKLHKEVKDKSRRISFWKKII